MIDLRLYQTLGIQEIENAAKRALYVLPTGGGRTVIATSIIERAVQRGERVLMLTHRREILRQTSVKMAIDHGLIQAGLNIDLTYPVQVASIQTLWTRCMRTDKVPLPAANLIIIDACRRPDMADDSRRISERPLGGTDSHAVPIRWPRPRRLLRRADRRSANPRADRAETPGAHDLLCTG